MTDKKISKSKSVYTANESEAGKCPKCGNDNLEYGSASIEDTYIRYPWTCPNCSSEGSEYGNIVFDGHSVDYYPFPHIYDAKDDE